MGWAYGSLDEGTVGIDFVFETERSRLIKLVQIFMQFTPHGHHATLLYCPRTGQTEVIFQQRHRNRRAVQSVRCNKTATRSDSVSKVAERTQLHDTAHSHISIYIASGTKRIQPIML